MIQVYHASVDELVPILSTLVNPAWGSSLMADRRTNKLVVKAPADEVQAVVDALEELDVKVDEPTPPPSEPDDEVLKLRALVRREVKALRVELDRVAERVGALEGGGPKASGRP